MQEYRMRGVRLLQRGTFAEAANQFRRNVRASPATSEDRVLLAHALVGMRQLAEAEAELQVASGLAPEDAETHVLLGRTVAQRGRRVQAVLHFERAIALDPTHRAIHELTELRAQISNSVHSWHLPMLADKVRNDAFQEAIVAAVTANDVVLDIGTGTGLLAMMAARAGARHVVACEMLPELAALAQLVVDANGYGGLVSVIAKPSTKLIVGVDMPERATILVSETFDSLLIGEGAIDWFAHARVHLLTPDAKLIPESGTIRGQLASMPRLKRMHPLDSINGFDLAPFARQGLEKQFYPVKPETEEWTALSAPFDVIRLDFRDRIATRQTWSLPVTATAEGLLDALILWFDLQLDNVVRLTSGPGGRKASHWDPVVFLFDRVQPVRTGDRVTIQARMGDNVLFFEA